MANQDFGRGRNNERERRRGRGDREENSREERAFGGYPDYRDERRPRWGRGEADYEDYGATGEAGRAYPQERRGDDWRRASPYAPDTYGERGDYTRLHGEYGWEGRRLDPYRHRQEERYGQGPYERDDGGESRYGQSRYDQSRYGQNRYERTGYGRERRGGERSMRDWSLSGPQDRVSDWAQGEEGGRGSDRFDPDYSEWRRNHIEALDEDYRSYRKERQKKFADDFEGWRRNRETSQSKSPGRQSGVGQPGSGQSGAGQAGSSQTTTLSGNGSKAS